MKGNSGMPLFLGAAASADIAIYAFGANGMRAQLGTAGEVNLLTWISANVNFNDGNWHHLAFTKLANASAMIMWVDGTTNNATFASLVGSISNFPMTEGISFFCVTDGSFQSTSSLDDVRYYNRQLSQSDIDFIYNAGNGRDSSSTGNMALTSTVAVVTNFSLNNYRIGMLISDPGNTLTNNNDIIGYGSRDAGTNWTQAIMADMGNIVGASGTNRYFLSPTTAFTSGVNSSGFQLKTTTANLKTGSLKAIIGNAQP
jgi:hypothetical protein